MSEATAPPVSPAPHQPGDESDRATNRQRVAPSVTGDYGPQSDELRLFHALEQGSDVFVELHLDGTVRYASPNMHALAGFLPAQLGGRSLAEIVDARDRPRFEQRLRQFTVQPAAMTCTFRISHADGRARWIESAFTLTAETSEAHARTIIGTLRDVSLRFEPAELVDATGTIAQALVANVVDYAIFLLDLEGNVRSWNAGAERIKGYAKEEILGINFAIFYTADDALAGAPQKSLETARAARRFESEGWRVRKDGSRTWAHVIIDAVYDHAGTLQGFAKVTRDITRQREERAARERLTTDLERLVERVNMATQCARIGIWEWDVATGSKLWDPVMFALYGLAPQSPPPDRARWLSLIHPSDVAAANDALGDALAGRRAYDVDFRVVWPNGDVRHLHAMGHVFFDRGVAVRMVGANWDITQIRSLTEQLAQEKDHAHFAATHDTLTNLLNRRGLDAWLDQHPNLRAAVLYMDLDGFKAVNDRGGHAMGDDTLRAVARIIERSVRTGDAAVRMGGDEFVLILPGDLQGTEVTEIATRMASAVRRLIPLGPHDQTRIGLTIGVGYCDAQRSFTAALQAADRELYQRKYERSASVASRSNQHTSTAPAADRRRDCTT